LEGNIKINSEKDGFIFNGKMREGEQIHILKKDDIIYKVVVLAILRLIILLNAIMLNVIFTMVLNFSHLFFKLTPFYFSLILICDNVLFFNSTKHL